MMSSKLMSSRWQFLCLPGNVPTNALTSSFPNSRAVSFALWTASLLTHGVDHVPSSYLEKLTPCSFPPYHRPPLFSLSLTTLSFISKKSSFDAIL